MERPSGEQGWCAAPGDGQQLEFKGIEPPHYRRVGSVHLRAAIELHAWATGVHRPSAKRQAGSSACRDTVCVRPARGNARACGAGLPVLALEWPLTVPVASGGGRRQGAIFCLLAHGMHAAHLDMTRTGVLVLALCTAPRARLLQRPNAAAAIVHGQRRHGRFNGAATR